MHASLVLHRVLDFASGFISSYTTRAFLTTGVALLALGLAGERALSFASSVLHFEIKLADVAGPLLSYSTVLGTLCILSGLATGFWSWLQQYRAAQRARLLIVEIRGLRQTADTPLEAMQALKSPGRKESVLVELRQNVTDGVIADPVSALRNLHALPRRLQDHRAGRDRNDVQVVVGGLAPVPFLFGAGALLDDESNVDLVDWDRVDQRWRELDADDGGEPLEVRGLETATQVREVLLTIEVSYAVDAEAIGKSFPAMHQVALGLQLPTIGNHWSEERQRLWTAQFVAVMGELAGCGVRKVHVVAAVPGSLAIRLGRCIDRRNMPEVLVHQYERDWSPQYPWSVAIGAPSKDLRIERREVARSET
jgi:hypothetical protein